jgi:hypothetical protein
MILPFAKAAPFTEISTIWHDYSGCTAAAGLHLMQQLPFSLGA